MKKIFIITAFLALCFSMLHAQESAAELPYSFTHRGVSLNIDNVRLPDIDNERLFAEDEARAKEDRLLRLAVGHNVGYTFANCGRVDSFADGKLWRVKFSSKDAVMMSIVFDRFNLPREGRLFVYSPDREQVFGPYTNHDVQEVGKALTDEVVGDEVVVEYFEPAGAEFRGDVRIAGIMHTYRDFLHIAKTDRGPHGTAEGSCHIDVACPEGVGWEDEINAVVGISITANVPSEGGWVSYWCTGAMVNNVRMDKTPYVLSANHCVATSDQLHRFYFNYQLTTCGGSTGNSNYSANGGVIVARSSTNSDNYSANSDFLLLRITGNLGALYRNKIVFAGWDRSGASSLGAGIHHPGGDWKKISLPRNVSTINSGYYANKYFEVYWRTNPNKGVTEQGSSGSPLFNGRHLIIGTLTAGSSSCTYPGESDLYGRLAYHWNNNGATANDRKLQPWLDPDNTGATTLNSMRYDGSVITGIADQQLEETFTVAPNPVTSGTVTVNGDFLTENAVCNVYNTMGQLVMSKDVETSPTFTINVNALTNGVYFVEIRGSQRNYMSKMIISR